MIDVKPPKYLALPNLSSQHLEPLAGHPADVSASLPDYMSKGEKKEWKDKKRNGKGHGKGGRKRRPKQQKDDNAWIKDSEPGKENFALTDCDLHTGLAAAMAAFDQAALRTV